jgi:RimJ/RimL family protein N-acetyltransferase
MIALRSARLVLDAPRESDIDAVLHACQDPEIEKWIPLPSPYERENAEFFVRNYAPHGLASGSFSVWALRLNDDSPLVGVIEVRKDVAPGSASLGCWLAPDARGAGYMHEALERVASHALSPDGMGYSRLCWESLTGNRMSRRLAESVGFVFESSATRDVDFRGERRPAVTGVLESAR